MLPVKWTFFYDEGNVVSLVHDESEDVRIEHSVSGGDKVIKLDSEKSRLFVRMDRVKLVVREIDASPAIVPSPSQSEEITVEYPEKPTNFET